MKALRLAVLALARDGKSGELGVLLLALLVAVSALTAVGFFTSRVSRAVDQQAGEVLAADLRLQAPRDVDPEYFELARSAGLRTARLTNFPSVVFAGEESRLTAIRAVSAEYPLRGRLKIADKPFAEDYEAQSTPAAGEVWAEARLLAMLGVDVGATLRIGTADFKVTKVLTYRPDQGSGMVDLAAPTLLMRLEDLESTGLVGKDSRMMSHIALFAGAPAGIASFKQQIDARRKPGERLIDIAEASPQIREAMDRSGRFLNLSALVTILLAAIAVAIAARRYVARHLDTVALMKSMGAPQRLVLQISVLELLMIAVAAGAIGTLVGYAAQAGIANLLSDLMRGELPPPSLDAAWLGLTTSVLMLIGFALPSLLQLRHVPPARVLRRNLEPPPLKYVTVYGTALAALTVLLGWLLRDAELLGYVAVATLATFAVLIAAGSLLVALLSRLRGSVGVSWRYGMANIARRGRDSVIQIVAFGLGLMVLLLLAVVRNDLMEEWRASLPENAPTHFIRDIRPDQIDAARQFFAEHRLDPSPLVPEIRGRLTAVNGARPQRREFDTELAERELNLSSSDELPLGNEIVAGSWWAEGDNGGPRVSIEAERAAQWGIKLGDRLTYDIAGETIDVTVASLREVKWDTFRPNFFMVFSPGVLDESTGNYITSVHVPSEKRVALNAFARQFPEVIVFDIDALLTQVRSIMDKASLAVQYVFGFTVLAGITVLLAAIQATRDERRYESAMLRTLGASRRVVLQGVAAEFTTLGLLAGTLAAVGATTAGYFLATRLFSLDYSFNPGLWAIGLLAGASLVGISGTLATRSVVNHPPVATLRG